MKAPTTKLQDPGKHQAPVFFASPYIRSDCKSRARCPQRAASPFVFSTERGHSCPQQFPNASPELCGGERVRIRCGVGAYQVAADRNVRAPLRRHASLLVVVVGTALLLLGLAEQSSTAEKQPDPPSLVT